MADEPQLPANTISRFQTLCGATVVVTRNPEARPVADKWRCLGCGAEDDYGRHPLVTRDHANEHAGQCRSMPRPTA